MPQPSCQYISARMVSLVPFPFSLCVWRRWLLLLQRGVIIVVRIGRRRRGILRHGIGNRVVRVIRVITVTVTAVIAARWGIHSDKGARLGAPVTMLLLLGGLGG